jgi:diguanylate cyclase (GGDEF)-like protein/PAS domain S-box-containing protein
LIKSVSVSGSRKIHVVAEQERFARERNSSYGYPLRFADSTNRSLSTKNMESSLPFTPVGTPVLGSWPFTNAPMESIGTQGNAHFDLNMAHAKLGVLSSLYVCLRAKHGPAASHSLRVALWASAWGIRHQIPEDHQQLVETVGLLHEIGKIGVPDRVLQKPEALGENELAMMDLHTQVGLEVLRAAGATPELMLAIAGIGTSYNSSSNSQSKEFAPLVSRLINIIDAYDSMTVRQVYREPISKETALAEIFRLGGTQFDPALVRSVAELILNPQIEIQDKVRQRWISKLEHNDSGRYFELDYQQASRAPCQVDRPASALVHTLNESFYRHMMDHIQDGVIFIDSEYRVLDWNSAAERMTGRTADSVFQQHWHPSFARLFDTNGFAIDEAQCPFNALLYSREKIQNRFVIQREGYQPIHVDIEVVPVLNDRGQLCGGAMILEDISETAVLEQRIVHLRERACQDQLTNVANRGELNRQLPEFVAYHQKAKRPGSVIICDIDFFKRINDNYSHQAGDEALKVFASILKDSCRETDFVARYGGEEFVLLCGECDFKEAKELAETIRKRLHRTPIAALRNQCMTASFGVSSVLPEDTDETVLGRADKGLLIAKDSGRDRVIGLGLDVDTKGAGTSETPTAPRGWISWLASHKAKAHKFELVTNVPRNVTLEKLKGFVNEFHATVIRVELDQAVLEVDCRVSPIPQIKNERLGRFRLEISVSELEMKAGGKQENVKVCTLLEVNILPLRQRDRRSDGLQSQVSRLKSALQGYLVACEMDDDLRASVLRRLKRQDDTRY